MRSQAPLQTLVCGEAAQPQRGFWRISQQLSFAPVSEDPAKASCVPRGELALAPWSVKGTGPWFCADSQLSATWGGGGGTFSAS